MHNPTLACTHITHRQTDRTLSPAPNWKKIQHKSHKILSSVERGHLKTFTEKGHAK